MDTCCECGAPAKVVLEPLCDHCERYHFLKWRLTIEMGFFADVLRPEADKLAELRERLCGI